MVNILATVVPGEADNHSTFASATTWEAAYFSNILMTVTCGPVVINERRMIVEPQTHRIIQVLE